MLLTVYPMLYLVWNNRADYRTLYRAMSFACIITGLLLLMVDVTAGFFYIVLMQIVAIGSDAKQ